LPAGDRLAFLAEISALLTSSLDYQETLDRAVHLALPRLGDYCNVLVEDEHGHLRHVAWGHVDRAKQPAVRDLVRLVLEAPNRGGVPTFADLVMKTAKRIVVNHAAIVEAMAKLPKDLDPALLQLGMALQPHAYIGVRCCREDDRLACCRLAPASRSRVASTRKPTSRWSRSSLAACRPPSTTLGCFARPTS
jgi:GAF domain-containing protein